MQTLPEDILLTIMGTLDRKDIYNMSQTCKHIHRSITENLEYINSSKNLDTIRTKISRNNIVKEIPYRDGYKHGMEIWKKNGWKIRSIPWIYGYKTGTEHIRFDTGKIKSKINWDNGTRNGEEIIWDKYGVIQIRRYWENGMIVRGLYI